MFKDMTLSYYGILSNPGGPGKKGQKKKKAPRPTGLEPAIFGAENQRLTIRPRPPGYCLMDVCG